MKEIKDDTATFSDPTVAKKLQRGEKGVVIIFNIHDY